MARRFAKRIEAIRANGFAEKEKPFWHWSFAEGQGIFFSADFAVNFTSDNACWAPVEHPEQAREVAQTKCNDHAIAAAGRCVIFSADFIVDFSAVFRTFF